MEVEIKSQQLKNILSSLITIQPEVNIIFSSNPLKLQFITAKYDSILYWEASDISSTYRKVKSPKGEENSDEKYYSSVTVPIERLLRILTTDTCYSCSLIDMSNLILEQKTRIDNCLTDSKYLKGIKQVSKLSVPHIYNHKSIIDFIFDYQNYQNEQLESETRICAIFMLKMFEKTLNASLDVSTEMKFDIRNNFMIFSSEQIGEVLSIESPIINVTSEVLTRNINIGSLSYIKAYRKISKLISIDLVNTIKGQVLCIKPITDTILNTELIIYFI